MDDVTGSDGTILYDRGINDDLYQVWRNDGEIGYVQLAFRIIVEAMYDLICGDPEAVLSASQFFYGTMFDTVEAKDEDEEGYGEKDDIDWQTGSLYPIYAQILGYNKGTLPILVEKHRNSHVSLRDVENLRNLYTVMATI